MQQHINRHLCTERKNAIFFVEKENLFLLSSLDSRKQQREEKGRIFRTTSRQLDRTLLDDTDSVVTDYTTNGPLDNRLIDDNN